MSDRGVVEYAELAGFGFSERGLIIKLRRMIDPVDGNGCEIAEPCFELSMILPDSQITSQPFNRSALEAMIADWQRLIDDV